MAVSLFGVEIREPDGLHVCAMCCAALSREIQDAVAGTDLERLVIPTETDWAEVVRSGRIYLCSDCRAALRDAIEPKGGAASSD